MEERKKEEQSKTRHSRTNGHRVAHARQKMFVSSLVGMLRLQRRDSAVRRGIRALARAESRLLLLQLRGRLRLCCRGCGGTTGARLPSGFGHKVRRPTRHRWQHRRRRPRVQRYRAATRATGYTTRVW